MKETSMSKAHSRIAIPVTPPSKNRWAIKTFSDKTG
jgi:hypothetical protein